MATNALVLASLLLAPQPAIAVTCDAAIRTIGDEPVRYFSPEGRTIAAACGVAAPGIEVRPLAEIEPPRNGPAARWTSPLCTAWHDATTQCVQKVDDHGAFVGTRTCGPLEKETSPTPHIVCTDIAVEAVRRLCATMSLTQTDRYTDGTHDDFDANGYPLWTYSLKEKAWDGSLDNDQRIVPAYKGPPRTLASHEKNAVCLHSFTGTAEDFVFIGR